MIRIRRKYEDPDHLKLMIRNARRTRGVEFQNLQRRFRLARSDELYREWKAAQPKSAAAQKKSSVKRSKRT